MIRISTLVMPVLLAIMSQISSAGAQSLSGKQSGSTNSPPQVTRAFGGNGIVNYQICPQPTGTKSGCVEKYEIGETKIRVYVWDAAPRFGMKFVGLCLTNGCTSGTNNPVPTGRTTLSYLGFMMTQLIYEVPRPVLPWPTGYELCAYTHFLFPPGQGIKPDDHWGCWPYDSGQPAGEVQVSLGSMGVDVRGWVIDPTAATPVQVVIRRNNAIDVVTIADQPAPQLQSRWPAYGPNHGFAVQVPFVGVGRAHQLCLTLPAHAFPDGSNTLGCITYGETPQLSISASTVKIGQLLRFAVDMIGPGAKGRLNLLTEQGFYLLPWRTADVAEFTADAAGHAEGIIPTNLIPPGRYRVVFACEQGCSALKPIPGAPQVVLTDTRSATPGDGPVLVVNSNMPAEMAVKRTGQPSVLRVIGTGFPPSTLLTLTVSPGIAFLDGLPQMLTEEVVSDKKGNFSKDLTVNERAQSNIMYAAINGRVVASAEFK